MTALEIQAIKKLPEAYVRDGTVVYVVEGCVVVMNHHLPALVFENGEWREMKP